MAKITIDGLDELGKKLPEMIKGLDELSEKKSVSIGELFTADFMKKHTKFSSLGELMEAGGFHIESAEDFKSILGPEFDAHITASSPFASWKEILQAAGNEYAARKIGL